MAWRMGRMTGGVLSNTFCSSSIVPVHTKLIRQCLTDNHPRPWASQHPPPPPSHHPTTLSSKLHQPIMAADAPCAVFITVKLGGVIIIYCINWSYF